MCVCVPNQCKQVRRKHCGIGRSDSLQDPAERHPTNYFLRSEEAVGGILEHPLEELLRTCPCPLSVSSGSSNRTESQGCLRASLRCSLPSRSWQKMRVKQTILLPQGPSHWSAPLASALAVDVCTSCTSRLMSEANACFLSPSRKSIPPLAKHPDYGVPSTNPFASS
jgi:hypothetical protein